MVGALDLGRYSQGGSSPRTVPVSSLPITSPTLHDGVVRFSKTQEAQLNVNFLSAPGPSELGFPTVQTCRKQHIHAVFGTYLYL